MAVLSDPDRFAIWKQYMSDEQSAHGALTKADIRAAVNALDDYFETNASAINQAIPQLAAWEAQMGESPSSKAIDATVAEEMPKFLEMMKKARR